ncbi:MAG: hypothetical protein WHV67_07020 [Thermoanaerobaculia bacterium]
MKGFGIILILIFSLNLSGQGDIWEKKGITGGIIQEIAFDSNLGIYIILTDSGIYKSSNLTDWFPINEGLRELLPYDFAWVPLSSTKSLYLVLTRDGVFGRVFSSEAGQTWPYFIYADPKGLQEVGGPSYGYQKPTKIGIYKDQSGYYAYLCLEGMGLFYRNFNPENQASPWHIDGWQKDLNYTQSTLISGISSLEGGYSIFVSAKNLSGSGGSIYKRSGSNSWNLKFSCPSVISSLSEDPLSNEVIVAGTEANGIFISTDGGENFDLICNQNPGYGPWKGISFTRDGSNIYAIGSAYDNASYLEKIFFINPQDCANAFKEYSYFIGESTTILIKNNLYAYVGTLGQGIWEFSSPEAPGKPIAVKGDNKIIINNVSDISFVKSPSRPDVPPLIFASSRSEGFYKCFKPDYCTRYFYSPWLGKPKTVRGTSLAPVPGYDEYGEVRYNMDGETIIGDKTIFLGTINEGIFRTDNGGASWRKVLSFPVDSASSREFEIVKIALAPDFDPYDPSKQHIFVLTGDAKVFYSSNGGSSWQEEVDLNQPNLKVKGEDLAISPAYNSTSPETQNIFVAVSFSEEVAITAPSILKRIYDAGQQKFIYVPLNPGFQIPAKKIALSPCFGFPSCPECSQAGDPVECQKEKSTILIGTAGHGLFYSFDYGVTIQPFNNSNSDGCGYDQEPPYPEMTITALSIHPKTDIQNTENRLLNYYVYHIFNGSETGEFLYAKWDGSKWICTNANTGNQNGDLLDLRINKIAFAPGFGQNNNWKILIGHEVKGMYKNDHPPTGNWINLNGFYNVPETIYSLAECPDEAFSGNPNKIVIAGTEHYGVMISFDSGESYFPFGEGFEYTGNLGKKYTLHNAHAVSCTGIFDPCGSSPCLQHRVLAAGSDCINFDINFNCTEKIYKGILNTEFKDFGFISKWRESKIDGASMEGHLITEIRYCSQDLPIFASDFGFGVLYSNKENPDGWGIEWHKDESGEAPVDITDLTCPGGQSGPNLGARASSPDIRPGRPGWVWGAQSGLSQTFRTGNGTAKFKTSAFGSWQTCTGLSNSANWRAIIMLSSQNVLIGSQGSSTEKEGIWRNSQYGSTCDTWESANMGFSSGDSPQITKNYSKKITAFARVSNGVLVAMESDVGQDNGGVFFSDTDSDGLAWVPVNSGMSCTSNYEVYNGQTIYTGSTCNGVYSTTQISYSSYPTAYFTYERSSNPWDETRFTFYDRSAGLPTGREWDFDNDSKIDATPSTRTYTYNFNVPFGYSTYNTKLISYQNSYSDTYQLSDDSQNPVEVVFTKIPKMEKDGNYIKIYWDRITSGGHNYVYNIYSSSSPQGISATLLVSINDGTSGADYDCTTSLCWYRFEESSSEKYYKIKTTW